MSRGPRIFVAILITLIISGCIIKYAKIKPEIYVPPPNLYQYATATTHGWVTGTEIKGYGEHLLEGSEDYHYIQYRFQPKALAGTAYSENHTQGKQVQQANAPWYTGEVQVNAMDVEYGSLRFKTGGEINVLYDPNDPKINGVPHTLGGWSKTTGYLNPYLWWYVAFAAVVFVIQEVIRMATKTNDL